MNSVPSLIPDGHRDVTVLGLVLDWIDAGRCWLTRNALDTGVDVHADGLGERVHGLAHDIDQLGPLRVSEHVVEHLTPRLPVGGEDVGLGGGSSGRTCAR
jgi:hypothetical protein